MTDTTQREGIPTLYGGVRFRSRLEARWAAWFDVAGWPWEYEPAVEYGYWIPDFVLLGCNRIPVEVKPIEWLPRDEVAYLPDRWIRQAREHPALTKVLQSGCEEVLVLGSRPIGRYDTDGSCALGVLAYCGRGDDGYAGDEPFKPHCDIASLWAGYAPHRFDFAAFYMSYHYRMGGQKDGDNHLKRSDDGDLDLAWREAGNRTQWRGRAHSDAWAKHTPAADAEAADFARELRTTLSVEGMTIGGLVDYMSALFEFTANRRAVMREAAVHIASEEELAEWLPETE
jgi:hypothetical protein